MRFLFLVTFFFAAGCQRTVVVQACADASAGDSLALDTPAIRLDRAAAPGADVIFDVVLAADGRTYANGRALKNDDAILAEAAAAHAKNPEIRAVIKADSAVSHGRVIHVLDLLKQVGVTKIAFGVAPVGDR
jgi:biopolymer transport protein ExbD